MADQCIVCLQDLASGDPTAKGPLSPSDVAEPEHQLSDKSLSKRPALDKRHPLQDHPDTVAHLLPCGHDLHHECLKPWVERANSCPICRQNFNEVELRDNIYGPCQYTYTVEDKRQVADLDPTIVLDDDLFEEPDTEPCLICGITNEGDVLILCDGCNGSSHTSCAGLESVPPGEWFCQYCHEDGTAIAANAANSRTRQRNTRTRAQTRRATRHANRGRDQSQDDWNRVWRYVSNTVHLDLEFPFDEDEEAASDAAAETAEARRRELEAWNARLRVAQRQGGAVRFQDTASTLLHRRTPTVPRPESQEELRAWNAFDKARDLDINGTSSGRRRNKRRSPTASPVEPEAQPERVLKRPRTRRHQDATDKPSASTAGRHDQARRPSADEHTSSSRTTNADGRSFFHSLLREVGTLPTTPQDRATPDPTAIQTSASSPSSEAPSSPASSTPTSPAMSARSSPRSRSASPTRLQLPRPSSPPLTSSVMPVFPQSPTYAVPVIQREMDSAATPPACPGSESPRHATNQADRPRSRHSSTRKELDRVRSTKAEVQALVAAALKPPYHSGKIGTEQYTEINRSISRKLYEQVNDSGGLTNDETKRRYQQLAEDEVAHALRHVDNNSAAA